MKVVWICEFTNTEIQKKIKPYRKVNESAIWITMLLELFENRKDIELFVISPHKFISRTKYIKHNGISYIFFNNNIPLLGRNWPNFFRWDLLTDYRKTKKVIKNIIQKIKPDLIHLHGAENASYSSAILQFSDKYPVLVTIQGFVSFSVGRGKVYNKRVDIEQRILKKFTHFGYRTKKMGEDILTFNSKAKLHWHRYNITYESLHEVKKIYDIVIFAKSPEKKGLFDLLDALGNIKKRYGVDYTLCVIGIVNEKSIRKIIEKSNSMDIKKNIFLKGFIETRKGLHKKVSEAKICVLPTLNDIIPGTIVESMALFLPVISYNVGSISELNDDGENVILVAKKDINGLSEKIYELLNNQSLMRNIAIRAKKRVDRLIDNDSVYPDMMKAYNDVITEFAEDLL